MSLGKPGLSYNFLSFLYLTPYIALFAVHVPRLQGNRKLIIPNGVPELPFNQAGKGSPLPTYPPPTPTLLLCLSLLGLTVVREAAI